MAGKTCFLISYNFLESAIHCHHFLKLFRHYTKLIVFVSIRPYRNVLINPCDRRKFQRQVFKSFYLTVHNCPNLDILRDKMWFLSRNAKGKGSAHIFLTQIHYNCVSVIQS